MKWNIWQEPARIVCALTGLVGLAGMLCASFGAQAAVKVLFAVGIALAAVLVGLLVKAFLRDKRRDSDKRHDK